VRTLGFIALLAAGACGAMPGTPGAVPAGSGPTATASSTDGAQERTLTVEGLQRTYLLYVPASLDRSKPSPLVIFLHATSFTAARSEQATQLDSQAERQRFVVAYPQGLGSPVTWNYGCCTDVSDQGVDDVAFIRALIERTMKDLSIDAGRVSVAGLSAGGAMAYRMSCEAPELVAAIAAISGFFPLAACAPRVVMSVLAIHGTGDTSIPYGGCSPTTTPCPSRRLTSPPVEESAARFRGFMSCPAPTVQRDGRVTTTKASPCRGGAEVTLLTVEGGGHLAPLGSARGDGTIANGDIPEVLEFLFAHPRPPLP
jgi:polyhydroxybutyrate depolymerase